MRIVHRDVQVSEPWSARVFIRELNARLREYASAMNANRRESCSHFSYVTAANATVAVWVANEEYDLESVSIVGTTSAGTATPRIDAVAVTGAPFNVTTTAATTQITGANRVSALSVVDVVTAGLTGTMTLSLNLRRVN